ncbi:hypothetical protein [Thiospirillum jenense]|uniref:Uncharacterized protein n=1 Tax=Thiospirillum jenense TaxID=1653858 RepID=A0A839HCE0_9GAMM|nr:hypothetical protein [Thiospirillum jenense]MBB1126204.1 hypothetical protein [Thiospirillum jenense]
MTTIGEITPAIFINFRNAGTLILTTLATTLLNRTAQSLTQDVIALEPTLDLLAATPPAAPFPLCTQTVGMVLYPISGGIALNWNLPHENFVISLTALTARLVQPQLMLRLYQRGVAEGQQPAELLVAVAYLTVANAQRRGYAYYLAPTLVGNYQAELGVTTADGGWLMLVRSNYLQLSQAVGAAFLHSLPIATAAVETVAPFKFSHTTVAEIANVPLQHVTAAECSSQLPPPITTIQPVDFTKNPVLAGSGPLSPYPNTTVAVWGHLRIEGQAPPGTQLDLGGHAYQVGAGGRFMFNLPLHERGLIDAMLQLLTQLPVEAGRCC